MNPSRSPDALPLPIYEPILIINPSGQSLWKALFSPHGVFYNAQYKVHYLLGTMRARLCIALVLMMPALAHANPVSIDGQSLIAFAIVAFWALVIESGVATLVLVSCGPIIVSLFGTLVLANMAVFLCAFLPLTGRVSLWLLEPGVVLADALCIKLVSALPFVQGGGFLGVTWRRAFVASLLGNTVSFFLGVLASGAPWIDHHPIE